MLRLASSLALSMALALFTPACSDDHDHDHDPQEELEEDACTHFTGGPSRAVNAAVDAASAPDATAEHTRLDVTLLDAGGRTSGFVSVAIDEAGDHVFFMNEAATLTLRDAAGAVVAPEETTGASAVCPTIVAGQVFDLGVGTYTLELESAGANPVGIVYFGAAHEH